MYSVKESSTHQANKKENESCPVNYTLNKIGGRWKPIILFHLAKGPQRYSAIRRSLVHISEKMLISSLRELETEGIIEREVKPVIPPHVTYRLGKKGMDLLPIFDAMADWGNRYSHLEQQ